jgi:predicted RNA-binding Zn-ribbon protein involved in translation (DUF1610 family)
MGFTVEQECPQCGAPIALEETDHLIICPYCNIKNYLFAGDYFRFILPHKARDRDIIYAPYMRFKGEAFLCEGTTIDHNIVDLTYQGSSCNQLPISLGVRPQAMRMRFVTPDVRGFFLPCALKPLDVLANVGKRTTAHAPGTVFHRAYIGEAFSLIFLPLFVQEDGIFDAVISKPIARLPDGAVFPPPGGNDKTSWQITFVATICPHCGGDLEGERDSVVLTCDNCDTAWEAADGRLIQVDCRAVPSKGQDLRYLPFWKLLVRDQGLGINTYADFIGTTKQPLVMQRAWEEQELSFWIPAFKIQPKVFLRLASQMTIFRQASVTMEQRLPRKNRCPVTLPRGEAAQSLKITLANSAMEKGELFPLLPQLDFAVVKTSLIYLPFKSLGPDIVHEETGIGINKNTLKYGRYL